MSTAAVQFLASLPAAPRPVRPAKQYRVLTAALGGIGLFVLILSAVLAYFDLKELLTLRAEGRQTTGYVDGKFIIQQRGGDEHRLEYEFLANGKRYRGHDRVPKEQWDTAAKGQPVPVLYAPSDPEMHQLGTEVTDRQLQGRLRFWPLVLVGEVALFALLLVPMQLEVRKHTTLLRDGMAVDAQIVGLDRVPGTVLYTLRYQFPTASGAPAEGKVKVREFSAGMLAELGGVTVLVDPRNSARSCPYFLLQGAELV